MLHRSKYTYCRWKTSMSYVQNSDFEKAKIKSFKLLLKSSDEFHLHILFILTLGQDNLTYVKKKKFLLKMGIPTSLKVLGQFLMSELQF